MVMEGLLKQTLNGYQTGTRIVKNTDIQELKKSLEVASEYFSTHEKSAKKRDEVAHALCLMTLKDINNGVRSQDLYFDYVAIHIAVWGSSVDSETASKKVRNHLNSAIELFETGEGINELLSERQCLPLSITAEVSSGKHRTQIFFSLQNNSVQKSNRFSNQQKEIVYSAIQLPKPYFFTKPFLDIKLKPSVFISIGLVLFITTVVALFTITRIIQWENDWLFITLVIMFFPSAYILVKLYDLLESGVTPMPFLMAPITTRNAFLVLNRERENEKVTLKMKTIVYEAECGVCSEPLIVEKSREFNGRYIGKCTVSPKEHIFSFDHITKHGKFLR